MCHADEQWTEALPLFLLGIRTAFKEDLQSSAAELVRGEPLRVPGSSYTDGRAIYLHPADPPLHEPATPNPGSILQ